MMLGPAPAPRTPGELQAAADALERLRTAGDSDPAALQFAKDCILEALQHAEPGTLTFAALSFALEALRNVQPTSLAAEVACAHTRRVLPPPRLAAAPPIDDAPTAPATPDPPPAPASAPGPDGKVQLSVSPCEHTWALSDGDLWCSECGAMWMGKTQGWKRPNYAADIEADHAAMDRLRAEGADYREQLRTLNNDLEDRHHRVTELRGRLAMFDGTVENLGLQDEIFDLKEDNAALRATIRDAAERLK